MESAHVWAAFIDQGTMAGTAMPTGGVSLLDTVLTLICLMTMPHVTPMITGAVRTVVNPYVWSDPEAPQMSPHGTQQPREADTMDLTPYFTDEETARSLKGKRANKGQNPFSRPRPI